MGSRIFRSVVRVVTALLLVVLFSDTAGSLYADQARPPQKACRSTGKRVAWIAAGAGAGFVAGIFLGLHWFDQAIDAERKVWTTAILSAAGGGIAAGIISKDVSPAPNIGPTAPPRRDADPSRPSWLPETLPKARDAGLVRRVRAINAARAPAASGGVVEQPSR